MLEITHPNQTIIRKVAKALIDGALVGLPTETVYGLAANAEDETAVKRIYEVKSRPANHPVIVHIGSLQYLHKWTKDVPDYALHLAKEFWPGPMTLILKRTKMAKDFVTGIQDSVGIRIPNHPIALAILEAFHDLGGNGLVAPSANKYEAVSPTDAESVLAELGLDLDSEKDFIINGGNSEIGLESTIINCMRKKPSILRFGAITKESIEKCLGIDIIQREATLNIRFSGNKHRHYAPKARIVLNEEPLEGDGYLALNSFATPTGCIRLASPETSNEFAKVLYSTFRRADQLGLKRIVVVPPQGDGIEIAILERLVKASR